MRGKENNKAEHLREKANAKKVRQDSKAAQRTAVEKRGETTRACLAKAFKTPADLVVEHLDPQLNHYRDKYPIGLGRLLARVLKEAPQLIDKEAFEIFHALAAETHAWVRPIETWKAKGKGRNSVQRSLLEHLFAKYPMPAFLWSVFDLSVDRQRSPLIPFVLHVASGGSVYEAVQYGLITTPLTRKMCHNLLATAGESSILAAVRKVQVKACGGDHRVYRAWMLTMLGREFQPTTIQEAFWHTVLEWICKNPMLTTDQYGPLVDYIAFRQREDPEFSMKGRGALALIRSMEEWHGDLAKIKVARGSNFAPSGFRALDIDRSKADKDGVVLEKALWCVREILSPKDLAEEGKKMGHCVYSYVHAIEKGTTSIWRLTMEDFKGNWHMQTIEVNNTSRCVVQVRGRFNTFPDAAERQIVMAWAIENQLDTRF